MRNLRVIYNNFTFPHMVKFDVAEYTKKQTGTEPVYEKNKKVGERPIYSTVMKNGTFNCICKPDDLLQVGEQLIHPYHKGLSFEVTATTETRPAKGDWSFVNFTPVMQQVEVKIN